LLNRQVQQVDPDLLHTLNAIGSQIGQFAERKRTEKVQSATYRAAEAANAAQSLEDLFRLTHAIVNDVMPARNFHVLLYNSESDVVTVPYFVDQRESQPATGNLDKQLTDYVLKTGKPLVTSRGGLEDLKRGGEV